MEPKIKKVWAKPDFAILDRGYDYIEAKSHPQAHEKTGYQSFSLFINKNDTGGFTGTEKQAIS